MEPSGGGGAGRAGGGGGGGGGGPRARRGLAYVCRNFGRLDLMFEEDAEAEAWLRKAVTLQPDFSSARVLLVYLSYRRGSGVGAPGGGGALPGGRCRRRSDVDS